MDLTILPTVNACLNTTTTLLLVAGLVLIKRGKKDVHKAVMLSACATSTLFLISYLYYHYHHGSTKFMGQGPIRPVYFFILITHTVLAAVIVPLILKTLFHAFRGEFPKHAGIARLTLPLWLYVSVTGVVVYWMLYQIHYMV